MSNDSSSNLTYEIKKFLVSSSRVDTIGYKSIGSRYYFFADLIGYKFYMESSYFVSLNFYICFQVHYH